MCVFSRCLSRDACGGWLPRLIACHVKERCTPGGHSAVYYIPVRLQEEKYYDIGVEYVQKYVQAVSTVFIIIIIINSRCRTL